MAGLFKAIGLSDTRSRLRISSGLISALGWNSDDSSFECFGWFRRREELLCAPAYIRDQTGEHPFASVIALIEAAVPSRTVEMLENIPQIRDLRAAERFIKFNASWTTDARSQMDINLGAENMIRLGWSKPPIAPSPVYVGAFSGTLLVISERRYQEAEQEELVTKR